MIKLCSTFIVMIAVYSTNASDSKTAESTCSDIATLQIHQLYQPDKSTLVKETLSTLLPNQKYISVSCVSEPMPYQNPYSGTYTIHDSICLYKLEDHQAEQYYNYLKNQITQQAIQPTIIQQQMVRRAKRKQRAAPLHMMLRPKTRYKLR